MGNVIWLEQDGKLLPYTEEDLISLGIDSPKPEVGACFKVNDYLALPMNDAPSLIGDGFLAEASKMMLYGEPKIGKSGLVQQMCFDLANGNNFLDMSVPRAVRTYYLQLEISPAFFKDRLATTKRKSDNLWVETSMKPVYLNHNSGVEFLKQRLDAIHPEVVVIDPLYKVFLGDILSAKDAESFTHTMDEVIDEYGITLVIVHHSRKSGENDHGVLQEGLGTIVWTAWFESIVRLKKSGPDLVYLEAELRNSKREFEGTRLRLNRELFCFERDVFKSTEDLTLRIMRVLTTPLTSGKIAALTYSTRTKVDESLKSLAEGGLVKRDSGGNWYRV